MPDAPSDPDKDARDRDAPKTGGPIKLVVDTNIFVGAGFRKSSDSARLIERLRAGAGRLVWHERTLRETRQVLNRIPMLSFAPFEDLFTAQGRHDGDLDTEAVAVVPDRSDRKFAALALATGAAVVSNDDDLQGVRDALPVEVVRAREALARLG